MTRKCLALIAGLMILLQGLNLAGWAAQVPVVTAGGTRTTMTADKNSLLIMMASWCPYCKALLKVLKDPAVKPYLKGKQIAFALHNEWPGLERKLAKRGKADQLPAMKKASGHPMLYNPGMLQVLPGKYYYVTDSALLDSIDGFPSAYSEASGGFTGDVGAWLHANTGLPRDVFEKKLDQYFE